jgi:hypothetical protein
MADYPKREKGAVMYEVKVDMLNMLGKDDTVSPVGSAADHSCSTLETVMKDIEFWNMQKLLQYFQE